VSSTNPASDHHRVEILREATTMVLYLSIVLLATLTALPIGAESRDGGHGGSGIHGVVLIGLIWGTTIGLALAHWFAFRLSARVFGRGRLAEGDVKAGLAQVAGAASVALLCTIPTLLVGDADDVQTAVWVLGAVVGGAGYVVARVAGRSKIQSVVRGALVLVLGLTVAAVKNFLLGH
jgi:hypothetical protein